ETKLGFFRYQFGDATLADGFPVEQNLEGGESLEQFIRFEQVQGMAGLPRTCPAGAYKSCRAADRRDARCERSQERSYAPDRRTPGPGRSGFGERKTSSNPPPRIEYGPPIARRSAWPAQLHPRRYLPDQLSTCARPATG